MHNVSSRAREQRHLVGTEIEAMVEYAGIASSHGVKVTAFVAGKAALDAPELAARLAAEPLVELGGHWFDAFPWLLPYQVFGKLTGLRRGPAQWQARDIRRTIAAIERTSSVRIRAWRDHAYRHDRNTFGLLAGEGIKAVSDDVDPRRLGPKVVDGVLSVPINVLPDHESIRHPGDDGAPPQLSAADWLDRVDEQAEAIVSRDGVATILAHPACMKTIDEFTTFRRLCVALERYPTAWLSELTDG